MKQPRQISLLFAALIVAIPFCFALIALAFALYSYNIPGIIASIVMSALALAGSLVLTRLGIIKALAVLLEG
jgi:predicted membrane metal-binding protein